MTALALQTINHERAVGAIASPILLQNAENAVRRSSIQRRLHGLHGETIDRSDYRSLLTAAAAITGTLCAVTFAKDDGSPRTMVCQPCPEADDTRRYMTVWDVEAADYRRVNLDGIVKVTLETNCVPRGIRPL
ncbi:hypothetical protein QTI51_09705 [Variovorax sp. J22G73]|uniref:hypothetical protein n=1 Tax=unclassified Variovorax TaxID=663243 RepID=UPI002577E4AC|nr:MULTISPECIES: hypothetical protein [unclassified Variovorax]MDM0006425.1 hypothetical protein [Variovorax sp. J22R203]MDM0097552.1 hypothetical protein [Variovorax sp. J22G73]